MPQPRTVGVSPRIASTDEWAASTLVLANGEQGIDSDTGEVRLGDGVNLWADLDPVGDGGGLDVNNVSWVEFTLYSDADLTSENGYLPLNYNNAYGGLEGVEVKTADGENVSWVVPDFSHTIQFVETGIYVITAAVEIQSAGTATTPVVGKVMALTSGPQDYDQGTPWVNYAIRDVAGTARTSVVLPTITFPVTTAPSTHYYDLRIAAESGGDSGALGFAAHVSVVKLA